MSLLLRVLHSHLAEHFFEGSEVAATVVMVAKDGKSDETEPVFKLLFLHHLAEELCHLARRCPEGSAFILRAALVIMPTWKGSSISV